ncbi:MAG: DUF1538 domain-containing protein [Nitrospinae bacterium]|nr:DUF1538 domain-containing protein [Nitrospinota bacterium]
MTDKLKSIRYGDFVGRASVRHLRVSYNDLTPKPKFDERGAEIPYEPKMLRPSLKNIFHILRPYVGVRFKDQFRTVTPLAVYLALFQIMVLRAGVADPWTIAAGFFAVMAGLMMFMEGIRTALMPIGENIGDALPSKFPLPGLLAVTFILGISVTFAEPAIGALKIAGSFVKAENAPYLYALLNGWQGVMVWLIGAGVGFSAVLGSARFVYGWSLKPLIYVTLTLALSLAGYLVWDPRFAGVLGFAWDCGAITTGPVTVPIVLALGIGIASSAGRGDAPLAGFGIVTLASLYPVIGVSSLAIYIASRTPVDVMLSEAASKAGELAAEPKWSETSPSVEIITGLQAVIPLVLLLIFILVVLLRERIKKPDVIAYGVVIAAAGMILFNIGLSYGLSKIGAQTGGLAPAAFARVEASPESPLFPYAVGVAVAVLFAGCLGFGATFAEPALAAMGETVQNLTNGAYTKKFLISAVSLGGGSGAALGLLKIIMDIPLAYILIPGYILALVLTAMSTEEFVNVAWDSAAVTTGPVTVPLILAIGLGFAQAAHAADGFGILTIASLAPIIFVLATGIWIQWKIKRSHQG